MIILIKKLILVALLFAGIGFSVGVSAASLPIAETEVSESTSLFAESRMVEMAKEMGISSTDLSAKLVGGVPVEINGQPVPQELLTDAEKKSIKTAETLSALIGGADADAPPSSGSTATDSEAIAATKSGIVDTSAKSLPVADSPSVPASEATVSGDCPKGTEPASTDPKNKICIPTKKQTGLSDTPITKVLLKMANWLLGFIAALAIVMIIVGGMMYLISGGDEDRAAAGKKIVTFAIIGLIIALLSWVMVASISMMFDAGGLSK